MIYIGKLIQQTTQGIIPTRKNRRVNTSLMQKKTLSKLIRKALLTEISFEYDFDRMIKPVSGLSISEFQQNVPISTYDQFYELWIKRQLSGEENITWPGKIKHFALSSGTTGSPSKRIPVSKQMIRSFQLSSLSQFNVLFKEDLPLSFYKCQVLTIGGSTKLKRIEDHFEGDLSGILRKHTALIARNLTLPGQEITEIKDFQEKLDKIVKAAPTWDVGILAGIPTWCVKVMEEIVAHYKVKSIQEIWPNFKVYVHGGVYLDPYRNRIENLCQNPLTLLDTYLASEGYFAYQDSTDSIGMKLLLNRGIFFEFIPFNKEFFDSNGDLINRYEALTINETEENKDYALVISTNSGLWRYLLGDLVRFIDKKENRIIISGRIKQTLNLCGEHLTLDNLNQAVKEAFENVNLSHADYTIISNQDEQLHHWYMEEREGIQAAKLIQLIDKKIISLNDDYAYVRKHALNSPQLTYVPKGSFYNFMKSLNKLGAQNKMPRVLNKQQVAQWLDFVNSIGTKQI
jgi:hypothetical protein